MRAKLKVVPVKNQTCNSTSIKAAKLVISFFTKKVKLTILPLVKKVKLAIRRKSLQQKQ